MKTSILQLFLLLPAFVLTEIMESTFVAVLVDTPLAAFEYLLFVTDLNTTANINHDTNMHCKLISSKEEDCILFEEKINIERVSPPHGTYKISVLACRCGQDASLIGYIKRVGGRADKTSYKYYCSSKSNMKTNIIFLLLHTFAFVDIMETGLTAVSLYTSLPAFETLLFGPDLNTPVDLEAEADAVVLCKLIFVHTSKCKVTEMKIDIRRVSPPQGSHNISVFACLCGQNESLLGYMKKVGNQSGLLYYFIDPVSFNLTEVYSFEEKKKGDSFDRY